MRRGAFEHVQRRRKIELAMPFPIGAHVRVTTIGKSGRVVSVSRGGRYRVLVGAVEVACRERDLEVPSAGGVRKPSAPAPPPAPRPAAADRPSDHDRTRLGSIDLHGATVEEALRAVEARADEALRAGLAHLDIVHGLGTGKVRHAVHNLLRAIGAVRYFEVTPGNPGVTRAYF